MDTFVADGKTVFVFSAAEPGTPVVYLNTFGEEGQAVFDALTAAGGSALTLVTINSLDWDRDMAPWDSPAVFKSAAPFTGGADDYLRFLIERLFPLQNGTRWTRPPCVVSRGIPWQGCSQCMLSITQLCSPVWASASGSLWFPGFREYVLSHAPLHQPDCVYFSLGDRENKTRDSVLRTVQENTEAICKFYRGQSIRTTF